MQCVNLGVSVVAYKEKVKLVNIIKRFRMVTTYVIAHKW
jgi:NH3-dependent NAD+ synthetase